MLKKSAFTLAESLIGLLIVSAVGVAALRFSSGYLKTTYDRDVQMKEVMANISTVEKLKAGVHTLPQLYSFSQDKDIRVIAVGKGEIKLDEDGSYEVVRDESFGFSNKLISDAAGLFRIEVGSDVPNSKIVTVVMLE